MKKNNPYTGNILVEGLGPILTKNEAYQKLLCLPKKPSKVTSLSKQERLHYLMSLLDLHIPSMEGARIYETIDLFIRQSYRYRDPLLAETWSIIGGEPREPISPRAPAMSAVVVGHSGTGKTQSILRTLGCYPRQVITHNKFPNLIGPHPQVVWLSVDVPASGKSADLAANLMIAWDDAVAKYIPDYRARFASVVAKDRRDGTKMLDEWRQVALSHFFGVLHLDEVQNFFKLATLKKRRGRKNPEDTPELSIVEDQCLRWILSLLNTWQIPVLMSGTLDGVGALTKRLSTTQRIIAGGYHKLTPYSKSSNEFNHLFFNQLLKYQFVSRPIKDSEKFRRLIHELTAGVPRIIISLWIAAHRIAFERAEDSLRLEDFEKAAKTFLAPVMPAVAALNSGDPVLMAQYDDLLPRDDGIWASFWEPSA